MDLPASHRQIRIFISSTFRDMQMEREQLVKHVFPRLRKICEQRGIAWSEVDLRWGITEEEQAEGKVLPICLAEIEHCRPFFLGLLGERYGWIPTSIHPALCEMEAWLTQHLDRSVTELEILHGVLNNPDMANHALFYLRDPAYVEKLDPQTRAVFCEEPSADELAQYGETEALRLTEFRSERLRNLKDRIRRSPFPVRDGYKDAEDLGQMVYADLKAIIDQQFPAGSEPSPLERESAAHDLFACSRTQAYVARPEYHAKLDELVLGDYKPFILITGMPGIRTAGGWRRRSR